MSYAIIGGTGLDKADFIQPHTEHDVETVYGKPSANIIESIINDTKVFFLARHGTAHTIAPHKVNYRANIKALSELGVKKIIAIAAVGTINQQMPPQTIMLPDQIIDYTSGREHTFFDGDEVEHLEFAEPYCQVLRQNLQLAANNANIDLVGFGTYGVTQGPRLETAAEIRRKQQDGCDMVGMTAMPEAALAAELGICYASIAIAANWAAGLDDTPITMPDIIHNVDNGMHKITKIIAEYFKEKHDKS